MSRSQNRPDGYSGRVWRMGMLGQGDTVFLQRLVTSAQGLIVFCIGHWQSNNQSQTITTIINNKNLRDKENQKGWQTLLNHEVYMYIRFCWLKKPLKQTFAKCVIICGFSQGSLREFCCKLDVCLCQQEQHMRCGFLVNAKWTSRWTYGIWLGILHNLSV